MVEVSPPSYPGNNYAPPGHWVTPGPTPSIDELCHKFSGRPTELRIPTRSGAAAAAAAMSTTLQPTSAGMTGLVMGQGGVVVAGECLDGEAIKRRLMANRLPESCV